MMQKTKIAVLVSALMFSATVGTISPALAGVDQTHARNAISATFPGANVLAKRGADDRQPDDRGTDFCASAGASVAQHGADDGGTDICMSGGRSVAKHGADDRLPEPCDDHGTDICMSGGQTVAKHGADDRLPEPCDDHGTDICRTAA